MQDCVTGNIFPSSASMHAEIMAIKPSPKHTVTCASVIAFDPQRNAFSCVMCILLGKRLAEYRVLQRHSKQAILITTDPVHPQRKSL